MPPPSAGAFSLHADSHRIQLATSGYGAITIQRSLHAAVTCRCVTGVVVGNGTVPVDIRVSDGAQTSSQHWGVRCLKSACQPNCCEASLLLGGLRGSSLGHIPCFTGDTNLQAACLPTNTGGIMPKPPSSIRPSSGLACCSFCHLAWILPEPPCCSAAGVLLSGRR